jgi:hypothetical protein
MTDERPGGPIRIGDQEREDAVTRLGAHYEAGRLSAEEHQDRVGEALQAKTEADLAALFADLPGEQRASAGAGASAHAGGAGGSQYKRGPGRPPWAAKGPLGKIPFPVLIALAAIALIATIGCVVGGGHPPFLPLLIIAGVVLFAKRRRESRA